ncbi:SNARE domain-containing protein [Halobacillus sp. Marseille-P3879]|uniref:SNARE domain-containing protein n=1 Tax=Halobacillus sp. Marseille-P3879 TaxID=2045014 RepID=UPI000C7D15AB|nr:SNARE domain-containing protein [Halobacillus sp. Marseille-P3879]
MTNKFSYTIGFVFILYASLYILGFVNLDVQLLLGLTVSSFFLATADFTKIRFELGALSERKAKWFEWFIEFNYLGAFFAIIVLPNVNLLNNIPEGKLEITANYLFLMTLGITFYLLYFSELRTEEKRKYKEIIEKQKKTLDELRDQVESLDEEIDRHDQVLDLVNNQLHSVDRKINRPGRELDE